MEKFISIVLIVVALSSAVLTYEALSSLNDGRVGTVVTQLVR